MCDDSDSDKLNKTMQAGPLTGTQTVDKPQTFGGLKREDLNGKIKVMDGDAALGQKPKPKPKRKPKSGQ